MVYKTMQACNYADNILLMARNLDSLREVFGILEEKWGLIIEGKIKYIMSALELRKLIEDMTFGQRNFQNCKVFQLPWNCLELGELSDRRD